MPLSRLFGFSLFFVIGYYEPIVGIIITRIYNTNFVGGLIPFTNVFPYVSAVSSSISMLAIIFQ